MSQAEPNQTKLKHEIFEILAWELGWIPVSKLKLNYSRAELHAKEYEK